MTAAVQTPADQLRRAAEASLARGDPRGALQLLEQAERAGPPDPEILLSKALVQRMTGDFSSALTTLDEALALEPYHFMALLSKGFLLEKLNQPKAAATAYKHALQIAPRPLPANLAGPVERARAVVEAQARSLRAHLEAAVDQVRARQAAPRRFEEALDIFVGLKRPVVQQPILLHYPELPAISFYDRELFPWLPELEAATPFIQEELQGALEKAAESFAPYIAYPKGVPVNQWRELNHSRRWSSFYLWRDGRRQDDACALCPQTAALLERLPMQRQTNFAPTAMFSALEPRTHIPAHTGSVNTRLLVHLPLILPGPCRFRVGNQTREWRLGEAWVFDDTIEHEAWNDTDELRVILIFDIWNPYLSEAERELVSAMMTAKNAFQAE